MKRYVFETAGAKRSFKHRCLAICAARKIIGQAIKTQAENPNKSYLKANVSLYKCELTSVYQKGFHQL